MVLPEHQLLTGEAGTPSYWCACFYCRLWIDYFVTIETLDKGVRLVQTAHTREDNHQLSLELL